MIFGTTWASRSNLAQKATRTQRRDSLIMAKLHFFSFIAGLLQPFLKVFQGDGPMIAYLCNNIRSIYISLVKLIFKANVLEDVNSYDLLQVVNNDASKKKKKKNTCWICCWKWNYKASANKTGYFFIWNVVLVITISNLVIISKLVFNFPFYLH